MAAVLSLAPTCAATRRASAAPFKAGPAPVRAAAPLRQRSLVGPAAARPSLPPCRSGEGEQQPAAEQQSQQQAGQQQQQQPAEAAPKRVDPSVAKGQRTAIITGAISIIFGVSRQM